ncbi:hypothetical protein Cgig2_021077 [Carnegiea gigantea]|uniref:Retrotransposon Copia-like N-terminal domain-containing protein n=1 Tax=Carnegiea gigantea TaxID=171969 RepID=A0A9Q1JQ01_9CARY|nr:hypothetical protein Cgig2_021077 [Carnegiea gigantea]
MDKEVINQVNMSQDDKQDVKFLQGVVISSCSLKTLDMESTLAKERLEFKLLKEVVKRSCDRGRVNYAHLQNPLFIYPSDGLGSLSIGEKLNGAGNYRTWRQAMKIGLSTKHKMVFVPGTLTNLVMFQSKSLRSRKYKLIKVVYLFKPSGRSLNEYYTMLRGLWEELDAMNELPRITTEADDVTNFLKCITETRGIKIVQVLIMTPLPSVDIACGMIQQEELQREVLDVGKHIQFEASTLYSRDGEEKVTTQSAVCGNEGHSKEKCWQVTGYPRWHPKSKKIPQKKDLSPLRISKGRSCRFQNYSCSSSS